jgi:hypothetical protein
MPKQKKQPQVMSDVELLCNRINRLHPDVYDEINIPHRFFAAGKFDISTVLDDNTDILFYNGRYLSEQDDEDFDVAFAAHKKVLSDIFDTKSSFNAFLIKYEMEKRKNKSLPKTSNLAQLRELIINREYCIISPVCILDFFIDFRRTEEPLVALRSTENELKIIMEDVFEHVAAFETNFQTAVQEFVYEPDHTTTTIDPSRSNNLVNTIILETIKFTKKVSELNIYPINSIVCSIVDRNVPINDIIVYDPDRYDKAELMII